MARRRARDGRLSGLPAGSGTPGVARARTDAIATQPLRSCLSLAPASCAPHLAAPTSGHRLIVPCDIYILLFTTHVQYVTGTPPPKFALKTKVTFCVQGVISPLLANIYLHYAFDLWANRWRQREAIGDVIILRYADDTVVGFEHETDPRRFLDMMRTRLEEFALSLGLDPGANL